MVIHTPFHIIPIHSSKVTGKGAVSSCFQVLPRVYIILHHHWSEAAWQRAHIIL
jgi:hypothetical protein